MEFHGPRKGKVIVVMHRQCLLTAHSARFDRNPPWHGVAALREQADAGASSGRAILNNQAAANFVPSAQSSARPGFLLLPLRLKLPVLGMPDVAAVAACGTRSGPVAAWAAVVTPLLKRISSAPGESHVVCCGECGDDGRQQDSVSARAKRTVGLPRAPQAAVQVHCAFDKASVARTRRKC